ncbi:MAG: exodeoxyribonuclease V subunit alpha [Bacteroidota bacterium]
MNELIQHLLNEKEICYLDYHFATFATGLTGKEDTEILLAAALVSSRTRQGHICIDLEEFAGRNIIPGDDKTLCPGLELWLEKLRSCSIVGKPVVDFKPLILDDKNRLYLYRYWAYEHRIAQHIMGIIKTSTLEADPEEFSSELDRLFPKSNGQTPDLQKLAAYTSIVKKFSVISGGPGTGKTTTVAKILALLTQIAGLKGQSLRILLAAPTGKAAARLQESIKYFKSRSSGLISEEMLSAIPEEASTIHRLLGSVPNSPYFRHHRKNPLNLDVLVIDEASMIDVPLMSKLLDALPQSARLILLGDKDQLSSVEAGKFLGDVCTSALAGSYSLKFYNVIKDITGFPPEGGSPALEEEATLRECFVHLTESHRFDKNSGIGILSKLVNSGDIQASEELLKKGGYSDVVLKNVPSALHLDNMIKETAVMNYTKYLEAEDPADVFRLFDNFRILCAMREGPYGVNEINMAVETVLWDKKLLRGKKDWYKGMPVMITENNYTLNLFNGDIGIVLPDSKQNNKLKAFFPSPDGTFRKFHQYRLSGYEKVYAMTVHKSQGSEFNNIVMILPDRQTPVLTRELLYTGITRARKSVELWTTDDVLRCTIKETTRRSSGLYDALSAAQTF